MLCLMLQDGLCGLASWRKPSGFELTFKPSFPSLGGPACGRHHCSRLWEWSTCAAHSVNTFWDALAASIVRARKAFGARSREGTRGVAGGHALAGSVQALMWGGCLPGWCPLCTWLLTAVLGRSLATNLATWHFNRQWKDLGWGAGRSPTHAVEWASYGLLCS